MIICICFMKTLVMQLKCDLFAPWPNARACHYKLIYLFNRSRKYQSTHPLVLLQRKAKVPLLLVPGPRRTWRVQRCVIRGRRTRVAWRDGPCRVQSPTTSTRSEGCWVGWTRRALPPVRSCSTFKMPLGRGRSSYTFLMILY